METVLITGGTGMIGSSLTKSLIAQGYKVIILTRHKRKSNHPLLSYAEWDLNAQTFDEAVFKETDHIIHLAGANVAEGRWTKERKQEIVDSRVKSGTLLVKALQQIPNKVKAVIAASAIGWYGEDANVPNTRPFTETNPAASGFLGETCEKWEAAIKPVAAMDKRLVTIRIGIVLSNEGGAYREFKKPLQLGLASILGSGKQVISWIHIDDLTQMIHFALKGQKINGVYNAVAPVPVTNAQLIKEMAKQKGGLSIPAPVPAFMLKAMLGEMSTEVLKSITVSAEKIQKAGFQFSFPTIEEAIIALNKKAS